MEISEPGLGNPGQVDGYAGFEQLAASGAITLAGCWNHAPQNFHELSEAGSLAAAEALPRIAAIYRVEADIEVNGSSAVLRTACRTLD